MPEYTAVSIFRIYPESDHFLAISTAPILVQVISCLDYCNSLLPGLLASVFSFSTTILNKKAKAIFQNAGESLLFPCLKFSNGSLPQSKSYCFYVCWQGPTRPLVLIISVALLPYPLCSSMETFVPLHRKLFAILPWLSLSSHLVCHSNTVFSEGLF
jgi:hypothetical protein